MPAIDEATYLRGKAANFRRLATNHSELGNHLVSGNLTEVANDLEANAAQLEAREQAMVPRPLPAAPETPKSRHP